MIPPVPKACAKQAVILGHALKNSMLPVITMMALQFSGMLSGAVITESIFAIPGIGPALHHSNPEP